MDQSASIWSHCLEHAAGSDVGLRRANNQDSYNVAIASSGSAWLARGHLFLVADGMGGHAAGELASKIAADVVPLSYHKLLDVSAPEAIVTAILDANKQIHTRGQASPDFKEMGTTCTSLLLLPEGALVAHVGDSRCYRLRGSAFEQLTFDHSVVWELRQSNPQAAANFALKNYITRSLGPHPTVKVDLEGPLPLQVGDTFLLCSDGLSGQVRDEEMGLVLSALPLVEAVGALINLANLRGGPDNITVIVAKVLGPQVPKTDTPEPMVPPEAPLMPVHPGVWAWLGVSALILFATLFLAQWWAALAGLISTAAAGITAVMQRYGERNRLRLRGRRFGRGPYVQADCTPKPELIERLRGLVGELQDVARRENWSVDWAAVAVPLSRADQASARGELLEAARGYLSVLSLLVDQLKKQRRKTSDSGIFG